MHGMGHYHDKLGGPGCYGPSHWKRLGHPGRTSGITNEISWVSRWVFMGCPLTYGYPMFLQYGSPICDVWDDQFMGWDTIVIDWEPPGQYGCPNSMRLGCPRRIIGMAIEHSWAAHWVQLGCPFLTVVLYAEWCNCTLELYIMALYVECHFQLEYTWKTLVGSCWNTHIWMIGEGHAYLNFARCWLHTMDPWTPMWYSTSLMTVFPVCNNGWSLPEWVIVCY